MLVAILLLKFKPGSPGLFFCGERVGRPTKFSSAIAAKICAELASGRPLTKICKGSTIPNVATVYRWLEAHESFREMYTRAREDQADTLADEIIAIADTPLKGRTKTTKSNGDVEVTEGDMIQHRKLQVDARKWIAAKLKPKKYGDRLDIGNPVGETFSVTINELPGP